MGFALVASLLCLLIGMNLTPLGVKLSFFFTALLGISSFSLWGKTGQVFQSNVGINIVRYQLVPYGNYSYVKVLSEDKDLPLYGSGGFRLIWDTKFDAGMAAFLDCLQQFKEEARQITLYSQLTAFIRLRRVIVGSVFPMRWRRARSGTQPRDPLTRWRCSSTPRSSGRKPWSTCWPTSSGDWHGSLASIPSKNETIKQ